MADETQFEEIRQMRQRLRRLEDLADGYALGAGEINDALRRAAGRLPPEPESEQTAEPEGVTGSADQGAKDNIPPEPPSMSDMIRGVALGIDPEDLKHQRRYGG